MTTIAVIDSDLEGFTLIEQTEDDGTVSRSWMREVVPIQARLNPDAPPASEARTGYPTPQSYEWQMPSIETWRLMFDTDEGWDEFREAMIAAGRNVDEQV